MESARAEKIFLNITLKSINPFQDKIKHHKTTQGRQQLECGKLG
jgi:hypothetical protein